MDKIKNIFKKIFKNKKIVSFFVLFLLVGVFVVGGQAHAADVGSAVATILSWLLYPIIWIITQLILVLFSIFQGVLNYNGFINATPVVKGWAIVRDLCNMFFIVILLVIAFATILRVEGYDIKKMVPKLIIMAILINFSKTICGLIIDAADLIMNAFVSAFTGSMSGNLTTMLGLPALGQFPANDSQSSTNPATFMGVTGTIILSLIFCLVALVVTVVLLAVLVVRMVMIWIYIVLSPLAYLLATFPQGQKYASQWWDDFTKYVITGPILAFFVWLAFITAGSTTNNVDSGSGKLNVFAVTNDGPVAGLTVSGTPDSILKFVISIGMLMGGLIITQQMGGQLGGIAGGAMAKINGGAKWLQGKATKSVKQSAQLTGAAALGFTAKGVSGLGNITNSKSLQALGKVGSLASAGIGQNVADEKRNDRMKTLKKFGLGRAQDQAAVQELANSRLGKVGATVGRAGAALGAAAFVNPLLGPLASAVTAALGMGFSAYHVTAAIESSGAKKKADEYNNEPKALEKTRDDEISAAGEEMAVKIQPFEVQRDTEIKNAETEKNNTITAADKSRDYELAIAKSKIKINFPNLVGDIEDHQDYKQAEKDEDKKYDDTKKAAESRLQRKTDAANRTYQTNIQPAQADFQVREKAAKDNYKSAYETNTEKGRREVQKNDSITKIRNDSSLTSAEKKTKIDDVETNYRQVDKNLTSGVEEDASESRRKRIAGYHPNKVTMDASKEIAKIEENAKKFAEAIAHGAEFIKSSATAFYSTNGRNDGQKANLKSLGGNPEALAAMVKELRALRMSTKGLTAADKKLIKNFKQGLASDEKDGGDISNFRKAGIIDEIENSAYDEEGKNHETVDGLKTQII